MRSLSFFAWIRCRSVLFFPSTCFDFLPFQVFLQSPFVSSFPSFLLSLVQYSLDFVAYILRIFSRPNGCVGSEPGRINQRRRGRKERTEKKKEDFQSHGAAVRAVHHFFFSIISSWSGGERERERKEEGDEEKKNRRRNERMTCSLILLQCFFHRVTRQKFLNCPFYESKTKRKKEKENFKYEDVEKDVSYDKWMNEWTVIEDRDRRKNEKERKNRILKRWSWDSLSLSLSRGHCLGASLTKQHDRKWAREERDEMKWERGKGG